MTFKDFCDTANKIADQLESKNYLLKVSENWIRCLRHNGNIFPKSKGIRCGIVIEHDKNLNGLEYELQEIDFETYQNKVNECTNKQSTSE